MGFGQLGLRYRMKLILDKWQHFFSKFAQRFLEGGLEQDLLPTKSGRGLVDPVTSCMLPFLRLNKVSSVVR